MRKSTIAKIASGVMIVITLALPAVASQATTTTTTSTTTTTVPAKVPTFVVPAGVKKWYTLSDKTASYPDKTDPTWKLPLADQEVFACIRYHESRNHLHDGYGSEGWYQFTNYIWWYATTQIKGLPATPNEATGDQQSEVAVFYLKRNGRFSVEWTADWACYS